MTLAIQTKAVVRAEGGLELLNLSLPPGEHVDVIVLYEGTPMPARRKRAASFLSVARGLKLQGPTDWAERLEDYLHDPVAH